MREGGREGRFQKHGSAELEEENALGSGSLVGCEAMWTGGQSRHVRTPSTWILAEIGHDQRHGTLGESIGALDPLCPPSLSPAHWSES